MEEKSDSNMENKFIGTMIGLAVGDALGAPFEFMSYDKLAKLDNEKIFEAASKAGELRYTDDTLMAIALAKSIVKNKKFDPAIAAEEYYKWYLSGDLRAIGVTTNRALSKYGKLRNWRECGIVSSYAAGNGIAMRIAPLALYDYNVSIKKLYEDVRRDSIITHYNEEAITGAFAVALAIKKILNGVEKIILLDEIITTLEEFGIKNTVFLNLNKANELLDSGVTFGERVIAEIGNSGYVAECVPLAIYLFMESDNFEKTVYSAIKSGVDADTHAAIAGAIAGCYYGLEGIPCRYIDILENKNVIIDLAKGIYNITKISNNKIKK